MSFRDVQPRSGSRNYDRNNSQEPRNSMKKDAVSIVHDEMRRRSREFNKGIKESAHSNLNRNIIVRKSSSRTPTGKHMRSPIQKCYGNDPVELYPEDRVDSFPSAISTSYDSSTSPGNGTTFMSPRNLEDPDMDEHRGASFTDISANIRLYQRNVSTVGQQVYSVGCDGEDLWKCKKSIESTYMLEREIEDQLESNEVEIETLSRHKAATMRSMHMKLMREFRHVQASFKSLKLEYRRRQHNNEMGLLREREEEENNMSHHVEPLDPRMVQVQVQDDEEYEEYIIREREGEVKEINRKMHQVNDIYKDLGQIVHSQQDHIDEMEDMIEESYENTLSGYDHIKNANKPFKLQIMSPDEGSEPNGPQTPRTVHKECSWMLPLENVGIDVSEARRELSEIRNDAVEMGMGTLKLAKNTLFVSAQCIQSGAHKMFK